MGKETLPKKRVPFVAGALAAGFIAFSACGPRHETINTPQPPTPTVGSSAASERLPKTDEQIVAHEANRWGVSLSANEAKMWQTEGYDKLPYKRPVNEETVKQATERVPKVLELMERSENPYLSQSATFLFNLYALGQLTFGIETEPIKASHAKTTVLATVSVLEHGKLHYLIMIDAEEMINNSNSTLLGLQFAHESEHIKNSINITQSLYSSLAPEEIIRKEIERSQNIDEFTKEESRAWGWELRAYIYQYGLGFRGIVRTNIHQHAVSFIQNGINPATPEWQMYVAKEILGIKNWQPKEN